MLPLVDLIINLIVILKHRYKQRQMFADIDTGFSGADEYDYSAYLTNLFIYMCTIIMIEWM